MLVRMQGRERGTLIYCMWGCNFQPLWTSVRWFLEKMKIKLPHDPVIVVLGLYSKELKSASYVGNCVPMCIAAVFTVAQPNALRQMNGQRKCSIYTQWNFIQSLRRMKLCCLLENGWNWNSSH
jgi:hypothetical protein